MLFELRLLLLFFFFIFFTSFSSTSSPQVPHPVVDRDFLIHTSSIPSGLCMLYANLLFPFSSNSLQSHESIFSAVFLFFFLLSFQHPPTVLTFFLYSSFKYTFTVLIKEISINFTVPGLCNARISLLVLTTF